MAHLATWSFSDLVSANCPLMNWVEAKYVTSKTRQMRRGFHPGKDLLKPSLGSPVFQQEGREGELGWGSSSGCALPCLWAQIILKRPSTWPGQVLFLPFFLTEARSKALLGRVRGAVKPGGVGDNWGEAVQGLLWGPPTLTVPGT